MTKPDRPVYIFRFRPEWRKDDPGGMVRIRRFLKLALRAFGLRCVEMREEMPEGKEGES